MAVLPNPDDEMFAQSLAIGMSQSDAYRKVFPSAAKKWKDSTIWSHASTLAKKVRARVIELQEESASEAVCTAREMQERLSTAFRKVAAGGDIDALVKVGTLLAKITGAESAAKVEVRDGGVTPDYREPPAVQNMSDEELLAIVRDETPDAEIGEQNE